VENAKKAKLKSTEIFLHSRVAKYRFIDCAVLYCTECVCDLFSKFWGFVSANKRI